MNTNRLCPSCEKPLAPDGPMGLCPECLIQSGLPTGQATDPDSMATSRFIPPAVEEMSRLFPQLEILELIGQGGMGAVYKARQKQLNRVVALKILPPGLGNEPAFAERFTREAQALAQLNHPGIVTLHEFGQAGGMTYFLMEFVDGVNLRQLLAARRLSPREALAIVPQICDALQFAHDHGIVHRDIKPENILLDRRSRVKVADFGLAKLAAVSGEPVAEVTLAGGAASLTEVGKVIGTPHYMSPEQRERPTEVDHRADIYALGVVFYQMLTGELPGEKLQPPSKKVQIDLRLDEVVLHALEKEPNRRYQQVSAMKSDVETISMPAQPHGEPAVEPSLSGTAVAGACLVPFFFISMIYWDFGSSGGGQALLGVIATSLGWIAIAATTVLGWVSVRQIRRSEGRMSGMWLAVTDGLLAPMVVLDLFLVALLLLANKLVNAWWLSSIFPELRQSMVVSGLHFSIWLVITAGVVVLVDYGLARFVWRRANRGLNGLRAASPTPRSAQPGRRKNLRKLAAAGAAMGLVYLFTLLVVHHYHGLSNYIGTADFQNGDWIVVRHVQRSQDRVVVRGRYRLASSDRAALGLALTPRDGVVSEDEQALPADPKQRMTIVKGDGEFELQMARPAPGFLHVTIYSLDGQPLSVLYFGTKQESMEERRLNLGL